MVMKYVDGKFFNARKKVKLNYNDDNLLDKSNTMTVGSNTIICSLIPLHDTLDFKEAL